MKVWGDSSYGGSDPSISSGVVNIYSTSGAFAALKSDGSVKVWGSSSYGGSDQSISIKFLAEKIKSELNSVSEISIGNVCSDKSNSNYYFPNTNFTKESLCLDVNYSLEDIIKITAGWHIKGTKSNV